MKARFSHPLWIHLPSVVALCAFLWMLGTSGPLPTDAPIHFRFGGEADQFGSPLPVIFTIVFISAFLIGISVSGAEQWARNETKKTFHYASLFDDVFVGLLAGMGIAYLRLITTGGEAFPFPWPTVVAITAATVLAGAALEWLRPFHPFEGRIDSSTEVDTSVLASEVKERLKGTGPVAYWEIQNPRWSQLVSVGVPLFILARTTMDYANGEKFTASPIAAAALIVVLLFGGMRTRVSRERVTVHFGTPGIRALNIPVADMSAVELRPFVPLGEFHGYGIRYNGQMKGVFLRGGIGVEITTRRGKHYLIGSDKPERLAAVLSTILESTPQSHTSASALAEAAH
ncbi:MAG: hypothetical protein JW846_10890 [Dehalococcoidia bacterium]|nr:hypothetical protein [Dehalococcoidia bacterium]